MDTIIEIKGLKKTFRDFWLRPTVTAVDGIDLEVKRGEVFGLIGPNGSGKSTTIKLLLGLLAPSAGEIRVFGAKPGSVEVRRHLGYLPELSHLHPFLTARETVRYYAGLSGLGFAEARRRADEMLEKMGVAEAAGRRVGEFSKGMARRVGFAAALVSRPELLVLDEPTSGLDPVGTREVKDLICSLARGGVTVLTTSHLLADVESSCNRIAVVSHGKVAASGSVDSLLTRSGSVSFTVDGLPEAEAASIGRELAAKTGREVKMSHPRISLEEFFLETLRK